MSRGKSSFKLKNRWLKHEVFVDRVLEWWNGYDFSGTPSFVLACKLKALKWDLKLWNRKVFRDLSFNKNCLLAELLELDVKEGLFGLSIEDKLKSESHKAELVQIAHLAEISWRYKSRVLWLKEGDNNMKFFYKVANSHRRCHYTEKLEVEGMLLEEDQDIRDQAVQFYDSLFQEREVWRPKFDGLPIDPIRAKDRFLLERKFVKGEVL
jgi:hypothetical protein